MVATRGQPSRLARPSVTAVMASNVLCLMASSWVNRMNCSGGKWRGRGEGREAEQGGNGGESINQHDARPSAPALTMGSFSVGMRPGFSTVATPTSYSSVAQGIPAGEEPAVGGGGGRAAAGGPQAELQRPPADRGSFDRCWPS